jgi:cysteine desulfurase/selenocysteine lyase
MNEESVNIKIGKTFNVNAIREKFPILKEIVNGNPLVYLDNAATTQKPKQVIDTISWYYENINSNVHRGVHHLSSLATDEYEKARDKARLFVNAEKNSEIIFTRGVTEGINLVASSLGGSILKEGDEVIISGMEHHSNLVPWQIACGKANAELKIIPVNEKGELEIDSLGTLITDRTKLISVVHVSNSLGTINPIKKITDIAHKFGIPVVVDGAQAAPHLKIDVQELGCDFYAVSGHKMYGPTGIGFLYAKEYLLENMPPYQSGGEMIKTVEFDETVFNDLPYKFEAGTPNIAGAIALGAAIDFINQTEHENIAAHEKELLAYSTDKLLSTGFVKIIGTAGNKASVISFLIDGTHPYDAGSIMDMMGIAVRTGYHCTQPLFDTFFKLTGTIRASFALYNTKEEVDVLIEGVKKVKKMLV